MSPSWGPKTVCKGKGPLELAPVGWRSRGMGVRWIAITTLCSTLVQGWCLYSWFPGQQFLYICGNKLIPSSHPWKSYWIGRTTCTFLLEKGMATYSSILAWRIPRTEEPGRLQSMGSQRVGHNGTTKHNTGLTIISYILRYDVCIKWESSMIVDNFRLLH